MKARVQLLLITSAALAALPGFAAQTTLFQDGISMRTDELAALKVSVNDRLQKHYIRQRGAEDPASIPYSSKMNVFFDMARRRGPDPTAIARWLEERLALSKSDAEQLTSAILVEDPPQALRSVTQQVRLLQTQLAQLTDPSGAIEIGRQQSALQDEATAVWAAHVEAQLAPLSREGRRTVDEYVNREVAPKMTHVRVDYAALYSEVVQLLPQIKRLQAAGLLEVPEAAAAAHAAVTRGTATEPDSNR
ncbi:MAG: hypothetical protein ACREUC_05195 [Steroidobacteraceae bacterium]